MKRVLVTSLLFSIFSLPAFAQACPFSDPDGHRPSFLPEEQRPPMQPDFIKNQMMMPPSPFNYHDSHMGHFIKILDLSTEQKIKAGKLLSEFIGKNAEPKAHLEEAKKEMGKLLHSQPLDKQSILALHDKITGYEKILFENILDHDISMFNLLTAEQQEKLHNMLEHHPEKHHPGQPEMNPPPAKFIHDCPCANHDNKVITNDDFKNKKNKRER